MPIALRSVRVGMVLNKVLCAGRRRVPRRMPWQLPVWLSGGLTGAANVSLPRYSSVASDVRRARDLVRSRRIDRWRLDPG